MDEIKEMLGQVIIREESTDSLLECLQLGGADVLAEIAEEYEITDELSADEGVQVILERLEEELCYEGVAGIRMMIRLNGSSFDTKDEALVFAVLNYQLRGWVYLYGTADKPVITVPQEIVQKAEEIMVSEAFRSRAEQVKELSDCLDACLQLYKVFDQRQFMAVWDAHHEEKLEEAKLCEFLVQMYRRTHEFWCEEEYIIPCELETRSEYLACLRQVKVTEYYLPKKSEIRLYAGDITDTGSQPYKELKGYLGSRLKNENATEEFIYEVTEGCLLDLEPARIIELMKVYQMEFDSKADLARFSELLSFWYNQTRLWVHGGHTPNETGETKQFIVPFALEGEVVITNKKIGRNDPCPCGSGRKYKQCCGK